MTGGVPLVAIRHAPTAWNEARRLQGRTDVALGEAGAAAARAWRLDPAWRGYRVLSSPLQRALATAKLLFPAGQIEIDARLMEMDFGAWEGKTLAELRDQPGSDAKSRESLGLDFHPPKGESPREVQSRLAPLLQEIARRGEPTIAVTHKAVLRALLSLATGWQMLGKPPVKLLPASAHCFRLGERGSISIERMNVPLVADVDAGAR